VVRHVALVIDEGLELRPTLLLVSWLSLTPSHPAWEAFAPLQTQLGVAVGDAAERQVAGVTCAPGDWSCRRCLVRAQWELFRADWLPIPLLEVLSHARALSLALTCE
jgi:hypothetical protein